MISALDVVAFGNDSSPLTVGGNDTAGGAAPSNDTAANGVIQFLDDDLSFPGYIRTTCMVVCVIILGVGVVGNMMVPIVILKSKDMRNSTNIFLMNLSIADLMVLLICTPTVFVEVNSRPETWVLGEELCKAVPFVELTVAHASVLTILAISFERYYAICEPLRAGYVCTKTRAMIICLLAWGLAALFTSPITMISEYTQMDYIDGTKVPVCLTKANTFWPIAFFVTIIGAFFVIPLFVLVVLYTVIAAHLMADPGTSCTDSACNQRARRQVVLMLATVVLSFFVCLLPFRVFTMWIILVPEHTFLDLGLKHYYIILYASRVMVYLNSAVNPILYNLMSSKFRRGFCKLCRSQCGSGGVDDGYDSYDDSSAGGCGVTGCGGRRRRRRGRRRDVFRLRHTGTLTTTLSRSCSGPQTRIADGTAECGNGTRNGSARRHVDVTSTAAAVVTALLGRHRGVKTHLQVDDDHLKESFV
ncbi:growth hormone secretagogue receptor type 1-like isoform X1 [Rhopalosiphum padi]|uniref:growth hormone secretagogue receptor type 1-like isoform X1 n=1 Tax=Rhopalosiphum padi TaxID=40932 RepID=UPI00298E5010|nr:growth hormone secretagogue receptor type 1-like isoform X1 [Rhopalosiphum padi]